MKILICGSRDFFHEKPIRDLVDSLPKDTIVIVGGASGADSLAKKFAEERGLEVEEYEADWKQYGRSAGPIRNGEMLKSGHPEVVYAFYMDKQTSKGTSNMVGLAKKAGVKVYEYDFFKETNRNNIPLYARYTLSAPHIINDVMAAKKGDPQAIRTVFKKLAPIEYLTALRDSLGDISDVVYMPILAKGYKNNVLPLNFAYYLSENIGGEISDEQLFYDPEKIKRKKLNRWERMVTHWNFSLDDFEKLKGKRIILIDDQFTTGGTIRDAYICLRSDGINVSDIICLGASRDRFFMGNPKNIIELKNRFNQFEINIIKELTGRSVYDLTEAEVSLILKTGRGHVIQKLKKAATQTKILNEKNKEDEQKTIGGFTTFELQTKTTVGESEEKAKRITGRITANCRETIPEGKEIGARQGKEGEEKIKIKNEFVLKTVNKVEWKLKIVKDRMQQVETRLNQRKDLTREQKKSVAGVLNSEKAKSIWNKQILTSDSCIAAARLLSGKEKNKEEILKDLPEIQCRIIKNIEKEKDKSRELER